MKFLFVLMTVGACCALSPPSPPPTPVLEDIIKSIENKYELSQTTDLLRQVSRSGELERELFGNTTNLVALWINFDSLPFHLAFQTTMNVSRFAASLSSPRTMMPIIRSTFRMQATRSLTRDSANSSFCLISIPRTDKASSTCKE